MLLTFETSQAPDLLTDPKYISGQSLGSCEQIGEKNTRIDIKNFGGTPPGVSRLSHGHVPPVPSYVPSVPRTFCHLNLNFHINPKRPGCSWEVPNLSLGQFRGTATTRFLYVIFLNLFFPTDGASGQRRDRILCFPLHPEIGQFSPHFGAGKTIHWRTFNNPVETAPRHCRFLSLVVVKRKFPHCIWRSNRRQHIGTLVGRVALKLQAKGETTSKRPLGCHTNVREEQARFF